MISEPRNLDEAMIPAYSLAEIKKHNPCPEAWDRVQALKLGRGKITAKQAAAAGVTFEDLVWVAYAVAKTDPETESRVRAWLCDVAAHVLHIFEREHPNNMRVRDCIVTCQQSARGEVDATARDAARDAASAVIAARNAARDAAWDAAWAAARDAAWADRAAAWDAAWAAASDAEQQWQFDRFVYWLSEDRPKFWPLPERQKAA